MAADLSQFDKTQKKIYRDALKAYEQLGAYPMRGKTYEVFKEGYKKGEIDLSKLPRKVACGCITGVLGKHIDNTLDQGDIQSAYDEVLTKKYKLEEANVKSLVSGFDNEPEGIRDSYYQLGCQVHEAVSNPKFVAKVFNKTVPDRLKGNTLLVGEIERLTGVQFADRIKRVEARTSKKSQKKNSQAKSDSGTKSGKAPKKGGGRKSK